MRTFAPLAVLVLVVLAVPALAEKNDRHVGAHPAYTDRQGGDTIATAVEVNLPFSETGATGGYNDDYDEVCPYVNSTSPDVVYTFTPQVDSLYDFDMAGSSYDTKLYLYDADLNLVACNDDFYPDYVSKLEQIPVQGGMQYYLVIDGYGGDFGAYVVAACEDLPCYFACFPDAEPEGEPPLVDGYVDTFNGGCDVDPPVFQPLLLPPGEDQLDLCGNTGWYDTGGLRRDSDWYEMVAAGQQITVDVHAPWNINIDVDVLWLQDCEDVSVLTHQLGHCSSWYIEIPTSPGEVVHLRVRPQSPVPTPCSGLTDEYELFIDGLESVVPVQGMSWSSVKQLYR